MQYCLAVDEPDTVPNDFLHSTESVTETQSSDASATLPLPGAMAIPSFMPDWLNGAIEQASDRSAEKTVLKIQEKYDGKFLKMEENHNQLAKELQKSIQETRECQKQVLDIQRQLKRPYANSEAGSAASTRFGGGISSAMGGSSSGGGRRGGGEKWEDKELIVGGGWAPSTPASTIKKDIAALIAKLKASEPSVDYEVAEFKVSEVFGEYCKFKLNREKVERTHSAWHITDWLRKLKRTDSTNKPMASANLSGQNGGEIWLLVHKPKQQRDEGSAINAGLRGLHLARENLGYHDNYHAVQEGEDKIQIVKGKFLGEINGCRWLGQLVGTLIDEKITWDWTALANARIPARKEDLEAFYHQALEEKKNKKNKRCHDKLKHDFMNYIG